MIFENLLTAGIFQAISLSRNVKEVSVTHNWGSLLRPTIASDGDRLPLNQILLVSTKCYVVIPLFHVSYIKVLLT